MEGLDFVFLAGMLLSGAGLLYGAWLCLTEWLHGDEGDRPPPSGGEVPEVSPSGAQSSLSTEDEDWTPASGSAD